MEIKNQTTRSLWELRTNPEDYSFLACKDKTLGLKVDS